MVEVPNIKKGEQGDEADRRPSAQIGGAEEEPSAHDAQDEGRLGVRLALGQTEILVLRLEEVDGPPERRRHRTAAMREKRRSRSSSLSMARLVGPADLRNSLALSSVDWPRQSRTTGPAPPVWIRQGRVGPGATAPRSLHSSRSTSRIPSFSAGGMDPVAPGPRLVSAERDTPFHLAGPRHLPRLREVEFEMVGPGRCGRRANRGSGVGELPSGADQAESHPAAPGHSVQW